MTARTAGPPVWLDGPLPVARPYRLIDVATVVDDADPHWRAGAQIWPYPPDLPDTWVLCPAGTLQAAGKQTGQATEIPLFGSFQAYLPWTCSTFSVGNDYDLFTRRAVAAFAAVESFAVEQAFSQGLADDFTPFLADANLDVLNGGGAADPIEALALLEDAIGQTGRGGVIHATPGIVTGWESTGFTLDKVGGNLVTRACGTPVVVGTGYVGASPVGHTAPSQGHEWAFATGPVQARRGDVEVVASTVKESLNRSDNVVTGRIERDYLVDWDLQLQAGVLVNWSAL